MTKKILRQVDGGAALITFNNPEKRNAVSLEMWQAVEAALDAYAADEAVRVLILTGASDKAFVSGADISKFESERAAADAIAHYNAQTARVYDKLEAFPKPTIAKIRGYCIGGGLNLAACCDLRIATEDARFAMPAAKLGLGYGYQGVKRLATVTGLANALELAFTARQFSAGEALAMGLANRVLPADELDAYVEDYAQRIADNAPLTIQTFKAAAIELKKHESARDLDRLKAMVEACFASADYAEGRKAFMEKRKPAFQGR
jgi:enoyl-CoA hydratase/carnithine racemase